MKLYHFTARHHSTGQDGPGIGRVGILPNAHPGILIGPVVWLTTNPSFDQGWATRETIDCDRTEVRIEVCVPRADAKNLLLWSEVAPFVIGPNARQALELVGGSEAWRIWPGRIPSGWLRTITERVAA